MPPGSSGYLANDFFDSTQRFEDSGSLYWAETRYRERNAAMPLQAAHTVGSVLLRNSLLSLDLNFHKDLLSAQNRFSALHA
jgi:hypothetical protein